MGGLAHSVESTWDRHTYPIANLIDIVLAAETVIGISGFIALVLGCGDSHDQRNAGNNCREPHVEEQLERMLGMRGCSRRSR
jgi:hypothetical protein